MESFSKNYKLPTKEMILINQDYFNYLVKDINAAKKTIDMETYIFNDDKIGKKVATALAKAAQRGVKIRLLVDGVGSYHWKNALSDMMEKHGVKTKVYHPIYLLFSHWFTTQLFFQRLAHFFMHINSRNHRKTCIIDNKIVYIGSSNITDAITISNQKWPWNDVTVRLMHTNFKELQYAFNRAWNCFSLVKPVYPKKIISAFRLNYSWRKRRFYYRDLIKHIKHSKKRIWIANTYFFPKPFFLDKLAAAAKRGVEVNLLVPGKTDVIGISVLSKFCYAYLLKNKVNIKQNGGMLHAKILIIDDWFCVGSSNLNRRSLKYDLEVDVELQTNASKNVLETLFVNTWIGARKITHKDATALTFLEKIAFKFFWLIKAFF